MKVELQKLHAIVEEKQTNICQIAAMKGGKLIYEDYWHDYAPNDALHVMSATKSIVSLLIGIAIDKGYIGDVNRRVLEFFPDYTVKRGEKTIQDVTIKHLLTMTAPYKYKSEPWSRVCSSNDWTVAALDLLGGRGGLTGEFKYSTLGVHILCGILAQASGMTSLDFANKFLFEPLSIPPLTNVYVETAEGHKQFILSKLPKKRGWFVDPVGVNTAGYGLCLSALDMVKIGQLCLQRGEYNGRLIVSNDWISQSTAPLYDCDYRFADMSYGYMWWTVSKNPHIYAAIGNSGNVIYVNPQTQTTVAVTAYFKPTVFDRVPFIQSFVEPYLY